MHFVVRNSVTTTAHTLERHVCRHHKKQVIIQTSKLIWLLHDVGWGSLTAMGVQETQRVRTQGGHLYGHKTPRHGTDAIC